MSRRVGWWGIELPGRKCDGTYQWYDSVPDVEIYPEFKEFNTIDDVKKHKYYIERLVDSCTACYVNFAEPYLFYRDQQDCIKWYFHPEIGVYTDEDINGNIEVVAKTIPEFLSRILIENRIWFKAHSDWVRDYGKELTPEEQEYIRALAEGKKSQL